MTIFAVLLMISPAILLTIIGFEKRPEKNKNTNIYFTIATVYVLIGVGLCGGLII